MTLHLAIDVANSTVCLYGYRHHSPLLQVSSPILSCTARNKSSVVLALASSGERHNYEHTCRRTFARCSVRFWSRRLCAAVLVFMSWTLLHTHKQTNTYIHTYINAQRQTCSQCVKRLSINTETYSDSSASSPIDKNGAYRRDSATWRKHVDLVDLWNASVQILVSIQLLLDHSNSEFFFLLSWP